MVPNTFSMLVGLLAVATIWLYLFVRGPVTLKTIFIVITGTVVIAVTVLNWPTIFHLLPA